MNVAPESQTFDADLRSTRAARRFVEHWLDERGLDLFAHRVPLAVSELAANAVLHTARPFTIMIRGDQNWVRIEAVDSAPELIPVASPLSGIAADITGLSETGRGLLIASSLANRWGMHLSATVKTVWFEFDGSGEPSHASRPVINDERPTPTSVGRNHLHFIGLPARTAIASGLDVEDAVRDLRSQAESEGADHPGDLALLLELVDRSMTARLAGRHAAMQAATDGHYRFDLTTDVTDDALFATGDLSRLLALRSGARRGPSEAVVAFRIWLGEETSRQRRGEPPTECPLSSDV